jgi:hypothetical protein
MSDYEADVDRLTCYYENTMRRDILHQYVRDDDGKIIGKVMKIVFVNKE